MSASEQRLITAPRPLPSESYSHPPEAPFDQSDYVIKINQMSSFYDKPGELGYAIHGEGTGSNVSRLFSPRLWSKRWPARHTHTVEEGHVVISGRVTYVIGDRRVTAEGRVRRTRAGRAFLTRSSTQAPNR